jgi:hypothetical protein
VVAGQLTPRIGCVVPELCAVQCAPESVVAMIVPASPTAVQFVADGHETPSRFAVVPVVSPLHGLPAYRFSAAALPESPTATHSPLVGHDMAASLAETGDFVIGHVTPPLLVSAITPLAPSTAHTEALTQLIAPYCPRYAADTGAHADPWFVVATATLYWPTAMHMVTGPSTRPGVIPVHETPISPPEAWLPFGFHAFDE